MWQCKTYVLHSGYLFPLSSFPPWPYSPAGNHYVLCYLRHLSGLFSLHTSFSIIYTYTFISHYSSLRELVISLERTSLNALAIMFYHTQHSISSPCFIFFVAVITICNYFLACLLVCHLLLHERIPQVLYLTCFSAVSLKPRAKDSATSLYQNTSLHSSVLVFPTHHKTCDFVFPWVLSIYNGADLPLLAKIFCDIIWNQLRTKGCQEVWRERLKEEMREKQKDLSFAEVWPGQEISGNTK